MDKLLTVPEFPKLSALLSGDKNTTNGITDTELKHLSWLGAQVSEGGDVVEIGSHRGKSMCAIGCGARAAGRLASVRLFAVDLWTKGSRKTSRFDHYYSQETWRIFNEQLRALDLHNAVRPVMMDSYAASQKRSKPIHLLFIDAAHDYKNVLIDFVSWSKFIPVGGWVAFHDFGTRFPGVDRVIKEEVIASGCWENIAVYDRIWSARRAR